jgi:hypothetical protein
MAKNLTKYLKTHQMTSKYTRDFRSKAFQNVPKLVFLVLPSCNPVADAVKRAFLCHYSKLCIAKKPEKIEDVFICNQHYVDMTSYVMNFVGEVNPLVQSYK